jgi:hypothetical protein
MELEFFRQGPHNFTAYTQNLHHYALITRVFCIALLLYLAVSCIQLFFSSAHPLSSTPHSKFDHLHAVALHFNQSGLLPWGLVPVEARRHYEQKKPDPLQGRVLSNELILIYISLI